jgi:hypothetical protein
MAQVRAEMSRLASVEQSMRTHPLPSADVIDRIERELSKLPCIGELAAWDRVYSFGLDKQRRVDDALYGSEADAAREATSLIHSRR